MILVPTPALDHGIVIVEALVGGASGAAVTLG